MAKKKARIIVVCARKGGVGKTTLATALAAMLAKKKSTLLVDLDPQASASLALGCLQEEGAVQLLLQKPVELPLIPGIRLHVAPGHADLRKVPMSRTSLLQGMPHEHIVVDVGSTIELTDVLRAVKPDVVLVISTTSSLSERMIPGGVSLAQMYSKRVALVGNELRPNQFASVLARYRKEHQVPSFGVRTDSKVLNQFHESQRPLTEAPESKICDDLEAVKRWL